MEKENLAQQYKVHEVTTPEEQCSIETFNVLTNDEQWTMTPEAHKYAAAESFCFVTTENGEPHDVYNLDYYTGFAATIVPCGSDRRFQQHKS